MKMKPETIEYNRRMKIFTNKILEANEGKNKFANLLRISKEMNIYLSEYKKQYKMSKEQMKEYKKNRMIAKTIGQFVRIKKT